MCLLRRRGSGQAQGPLCRGTCPAGSAGGGWEDSLPPGPSQQPTTTGSTEALLPMTHGPRSGSRPPPPGECLSLSPCWSSWSSVLEVGPQAHTSESSRIRSQLGPADTDAGTLIHMPVQPLGAHTTVACKPQALVMVSDDLPPSFRGEASLWAPLTPPWVWKCSVSGSRHLQAGVVTQTVIPFGFSLNLKLGNSL